MASSFTSEQRCGSCKRLLPIDSFAPSYRGTPGTWCRSCFAAYHRGEDPVVPHEPRTCKQCEEQYIPKQLKSRAAFCSRQCKAKYRNAVRQAEINAAKPDRWCAYCGALLPKAMRSDARFCSEECNMRAHRQTRNFRRRLAGDAPLRPRKTPLVNLSAIGERDGWRCGICRSPVDRRLRHPDPLAPSLDHVVPVSEGGVHEPGNLRLTHLRCNLARRDRGGSEQLALA